MADRARANLALGRALRQLREQRGMTQEELADAAGIHSVSLSRIERGVRNATWGVIVALSEGLGTTPTKVATLAERLRNKR